MGPILTTHIFYNKHKKSDNNIETLEILESPGILTIQSMANSLGDLPMHLNNSTTFDLTLSFGRQSMHFRS